MNNMCDSAMTGLSQRDRDIKKEVSLLENENGFVITIREHMKRRSFVAVSPEDALELIRGYLERDLNAEAKEIIEEENRTKTDPA
jgi:hypothetical protein